MSTENNLLDEIISDMQKMVVDMEKKMEKPEQFEMNLVTSDKKLHFSPGPFTDEKNRWKIFVPFILIDQKAIPFGANEIYSYFLTKEKAEEVIKKFIEQPEHRDKKVYLCEFYSNT